ncbi:hypothetical protein [Pseudofrankia saprophytica]|uniref:hypothetical protein n=1 Tax=Pseudofrankia saprophytica TaxID=298655 RepID=UPI000D08B0FC|nr:hypothetical protein [Pseudofrankia saprophytica]
MPLPEPLITEMREDLFWSEVLWEDAWEDAWVPQAARKPSVRFAVDVGDDYGIGTNVMLGSGMQSLEIYAPGSADGEDIGYVDGAHPMPKALRWEELELVCRASALRDPEIRHPGPVAALLLPYLLRDGSESLDAVSPVLDAAFRLVRPQPGHGLRSETRSRLKWPPPKGTTWVTRPDGHLAVTNSGWPPLNSYRTPEAEHFPFGVLAGLFDAARATVAAVAAAAPLTEPAVRSALEVAIRDQDVSALANALRDVGYGDDIEYDDDAFYVEDAWHGNAVVLRALEAPTEPVETAWVLEVLSGAAQGSVIARWFGESPMHHLRLWELDLRLVNVGRSFARIRNGLEKLERSEVLARVGRADAVGPDELRLPVVVGRDDLPAARAAIREVLAQADHGVTASLWNGDEEIGLSSEQ